MTPNAREIRVHRSGLRLGERAHRVTGGAPAGDDGRRREPEDEQSEARDDEPRGDSPERRGGLGRGPVQGEPFPRVWPAGGGRLEQPSSRTVF